MHRVRVVLGFCATLLLTACGMDQHYEKGLHGTWACDGYGIEVAGETFYADGRYARFVFGAATATSPAYRLPELHEGRYEFSRRGLTIRSIRLADHTYTSKSEEANAGTVVRFQTQKLTPNFIELLQETLDAKEPRRIKTCRRIEEKNLGEHHARYKQKRLARLNLDATPPPKPLDPPAPTPEVATVEASPQESKGEISESELTSPAEPVVEPPSRDKLSSPPASAAFDPQLLLAKQRALENLTALDILLRNKTVTYATLKALSASLLPKLQLMRIEMKQGHYEIHGVADSKDRITRYISNLNRSPYVDQLTLQRLLERNGKHYFNFKFRQHESSSDLPYLDFKSAEHPKQSIREHRQQLKQLKNTRQALLTRLPSQDRQNSTLQKLQQMAKDAGLHFTRYEKIKPKKTRGVTATRVEITAYGNYDAFMLYMGRVALLKFPVTVELMTLDPFHYRRDSGKVDVVMHLSIYQSPKSSGETPGSSGISSTESDSLSPYPVLKLHDPQYTWNPFSSVSDRTHELCEEMMGKNDIDKLELVRTETADRPVAWIKSPRGQIWRVKQGTCITKNIHVTKIVEGKVELHGKSPSSKEKPTVITKKAEDKIR